MTAQGEFDRTVKSDFTTAPNPTLFWRGPVQEIPHDPRGPSLGIAPITFLTMEGCFAVGFCATCALIIITST